MTRGRAPLLGLALVAVVVAGWAGLARMGIVAPAPGAATAAHGALMVSGFIGTLIGLERAVVTRRWWAELAPALSGGGALALLVGVPGPAPELAIAAAAAVLALVTVRGAPAGDPVARAVMTAGALAWLAGALVWASGAGAFRAMPWWLLFLVLLIAAERMELSRALRPSRAAALVLAGGCALAIAGVALTWWDLTAGLRLTGLGTIVLALWLLLRDRPPAAARLAGFPRFAAVSLAAAYVWLGAGALFLITYAGPPAGPRYDAMVHAVFVGFVFSTIFGHGPIVVPAVIGTAIAYRRALFVPLAALQLSLLARVAGDLLGRADARDAGAVGIALSFVAYAAVMASSVRARRAASRQAVREAGLR